jgi:hypothetical protein
VAAFWLLAGLLLSWSHLSGRWRRLSALLASVAGVAFLIQAVNSEGLRESPTVAAFLLGTPYVTQSASASASLPYYILTGVCLLLGTLGLALSDDVAGRLAKRWLDTAIGLSIAITLLRFGLEKVAAPAAWTYPVGIIWLCPLVGGFFALQLKAEGKGFRALLRTLAVYAFSVRGFVAVVVAVASLLRLGSHYDVTPFVSVPAGFSGRTYTFTPGSLDQLLSLGVFPQLVFWPVFTIVTGLLGAGITLLATGSGLRSGEAQLPTTPMTVSSDPGR